jgi:hypothetical protein
VLIAGRKAVAMSEANNSLPPEIRVIQLAYGVRYRLPRLLGRRFAGLIVMWAGWIFSVTFVALDINAFRRGGWPATLSPLGCGAVIGHFLLVCGFVMLTASNRIELVGGTLRTVRGVWPVRWRPGREIESIRRLEAKETGDELRVRNWTWPVGELIAHCDGARPLRLVSGYPYPWLEALARELTRRLEAVSSRPGVEAVATPVREPYTGLERPAGSEALLRRAAEGLILTVPPSLSWPGVAVLFACLALPFGVLLSLVALWGGVPVVMLLIWAVFGLLFMATLIPSSRRRAVFTVTGDRLEVTRTGIFGNRGAAWRRDEIADVRACPMRPERGSRSPLELRIEPKTGRPFRLLPEHDKPDELEWVASVLRDALHLPAPRGSGRAPRPGLNH